MLPEVPAFGAWKVPGRDRCEEREGTDLDCGRPEVPTEATGTGSNVSPGQMLPQPFLSPVPVNTCVQPSVGAEAEQAEGEEDPRQPGSARTPPLRPSPCQAKAGVCSPLLLVKGTSSASGEGLPPISKGFPKPSIQAGSLRTGVYSRVRGVILPESTANTADSRCFQELCSISSPCTRNY